MLQFEAGPFWSSHDFAGGLRLAEKREDRGARTLLALQVDQRGERSGAKFDQDFTKTERRVAALDGIRGLMTILVVLSHYFAEVRGGLPVAYGWVAVDGFFVISGFLVGRLILDKGHHPNFYGVFYARRILRTFPIYFFCVSLVVAASAWMGAQGSPSVPLWSYFLFAQNLFMSAQSSTGTEWIAPTWTLAVEEQFYLIVPALMLVTPRRHLFPVLGVIWFASVGMRFGFALRGDAITALALLPTRVDGLTAGLCAALAARNLKVDWTSLASRTVPVLALAMTLSIRLVFGSDGPCFIAASHAVLSVGAAFFLLSVVAGSPEAERFKGRVLGFFGNTSYATYLTHLPILWAAHAVFCQASPSLTDAKAWLVTVLCLPVVVGTAWLLTRIVEEPITAIGRGINWGDRSFLLFPLIGTKLRLAKTTLSACKLPSSDDTRRKDAPAGCGHERYGSLSGTTTFGD